MKEDFQHSIKNAENSFEKAKTISRAISFYLDHDKNCEMIISYSNSLLELLNTSNFEFTESRQSYFLYNVTEGFLYCGGVEKAVDLALQGASLLYVDGKIKTPDLYIKHLLHIAKCYSLLDQHQLSAQYYQDVINWCTSDSVIIEEYKSNNYLYESYIALSKLNILLGNAKSSLDNVNKVLGIAKEASDTIKLATIYNLEGDNYLERGMDSMALVYHEYAARLVYNLTDCDGCAQFLGNNYHEIAWKYFREKNYSKSTTYFSLVLLTYDNVLSEVPDYKNTDESFMTACAGLAVLSLISGYDEEAIMYYKLAIEHPHNPRVFLVANKQIASIYLKMNQLDSARKYLSKAIKQFGVYFVSQIEQEEEIALLEEQVRDDVRNQNILFHENERVYSEKEYQESENKNLKKKNIIYLLLGIVTLIAFLASYQGYMRMRDKKSITEKEKEIVHLRNVNLEKDNKRLRSMHNEAKAELELLKTKHKQSKSNKSFDEKIKEWIEGIFTSLAKTKMGEKWKPFTRADKEAITILIKNPTATYPELGNLCKRKVSDSSFRDRTDKLKKIFGIQSEEDKIEIPLLLMKLALKSDQNVIPQKNPHK